MNVITRFGRRFGSASASRRRTVRPVGCVLRACWQFAMGAHVSRTDFEWVYTEEPHASRRELILSQSLRYIRSPPYRHPYSTAPARAANSTDVYRYVFHVRLTETWITDVGCNVNAIDCRHSIACLDRLLPTSCSSPTISICVRNYILHTRTDSNWTYVIFDVSYI